MIIMKLLTMLISVSLFIPVVLDKSLTDKQQWTLVFVWMLFFMCSVII
jgi:hypothetical protein